MFLPIRDSLRELCHLGRSQKVTPCVQACVILKKLYCLNMKSIPPRPNCYLLLSLAATAVLTKCGRWGLRGGGRSWEVRPVWRGPVLEGGLLPCSHSLLPVFLEVSGVFLHTFLTAWHPASLGAQNQQGQGAEIEIAQWTEVHILPNRLLSLVFVIAAMKLRIS